MPSKLTPQARAHQYLKASMHAGYTGLPAEHREAYQAQMRSHERAYPRVREHALAGADRDFDRPLQAGEREHQRHLRTQEGLQEHDVHRIRGELRDTTSGAGAKRRASRSARGAGAGAGPRAAAAAAGAAGSAIPAIGGSTPMYLLGVALLLCLVYLLVAGKGAKSITGVVNTLVGGVGAFVRPVDPLSELETALGAKPTIETPQGAAVGSPYAPASGTPITGNKSIFANSLAKLTGLNSRVVQAWMNHEQGESTVEGGNNWLNIETGEPGGGSGPYGTSAKEVERLGPEDAALATAEWLAKNQPGILAARGKGPTAEIQAIENSGFAESHYGNASPSAFLSAAP